MATATIVISDVVDDEGNETGQLNIKIELVPPVEKDEQPQDARAVAARFLQWLQEQLGN